MTQLPIRTTPWNPSLPTATILVRARGMAAAEELAPEGGSRGDGEGDEAAFFDLELDPLTGKASFQAGEEKGEQEAVGDAAKPVPGAEAGPPETLRQLRGEARLRALVRRLTRPKAAVRAAVGGGAAAPEENRRAQSARRSRVGVVSTDEERRAPEEAAAKHLVGKTPTPVRRSRIGDPTRPFRPPATAVLSGRKSRGEDGLREACRRVSISGRASAVATPPPRQRRDDSLRQAQDDIAGAIAHCKLSLDQDA